jgi:hypothetical protein
MSEDDAITTEKAFWTHDDEALLIQILSDRKGEMTSNAMFKDTVFTDMAIALESIRKKGGRKTTRVCREKWQRVRISFVHVLPVS